MIGVTGYPIEAETVYSLCLLVSHTQKQADIKHDVRNCSMNANMEQLMKKEQEGLQHWLVYEPFDKKPEQVFETSPYVQILPGI